MRAKISTRTPPSRRKLKVWLLCGEKIKRHVWRTLLSVFLSGVGFIGQCFPRPFMNEKAQKRVALTSRGLLRTTLASQATDW